MSLYISRVTLLLLYQCGFAFGWVLPTVSEGDVGSPHKLQCNFRGDVQMVTWQKDGFRLSSDLSWDATSTTQTLVSPALQRGDAGNYTCIADNGSRLQIILIVKTPPAKLDKASVHISTVVATVRWSVLDDGGYPISHFTLLYRPLAPNFTYYSGEEENWHLSVPLHISPAMRQCFVYHLKPGTSYAFRMWASNKLGPGDPVTMRATGFAGNNSTGLAEHLLQASGGDLEMGTSAWVIAVSMVMGTVLVLSCLGCILIYKESKSSRGLGESENEDEQAHVITNPGFDLEERPLLEQADFNDNTQRRLLHLNNNSVVRPSRV